MACTTVSINSSNDNSDNDNNDKGTGKKLGGLYIPNSASEDNPLCETRNSKGISFVTAQNEESLKHAAKPAVEICIRPSALVAGVRLLS